MIEILTFKLIIDLFDHLRTYSMELSYVQIFKWKKKTGKFQYFSFNSYDELYNFYYETYYPFDICAWFGDIWAVNKFTVTTQLDPTYTMSLSAFDVNGDGYVRDTSQFDNRRNSVWGSSKDRQISFLQKTIDEYSAYYQELYSIYLSGIYSVCYAVPGWTEHTTILQSYRDMLMGSNNNNNDFVHYANVVFDQN